MTVLTLLLLVASLVLFILAALRPADHPKLLAWGLAALAGSMLIGRVV